MREIIIKNQSQFDKIPLKPRKYIVVYIDSKDTINVTYRENCKVEALGNSSVKACDNSSVKACDNSSVEACDNSSVIALGNSGIHLYSDLATVTLFSFSVCWELSKKKAIKKSKTATIIRPKIIKGVDAWLEREAIKNNKKVVLFKKVSKDLKTQEDTPNETHWKIGTTLIHHNWRPRDNECGEGKFHACSRTYFCDEFRNEPGDRYIAIEIDKKDLFVWDNNPAYPHKIAFRKGKVLYEVDKIGRKI